MFAMRTRSLQSRVFWPAAVTIMILVFYAYLNTNSADSTPDLSFPTPAPRVPNAYQRVLVEDGRVRDCISGDVRSADVKGFVQTTELVSAGTGEERTASAMAFREIFHKKAWRTDKSGLAASGGGSKLDFTVEVISALDSLIFELKLRLGVERIRLLDVPCGDMIWMRRFLQDRHDVDYTCETQSIKNVTLKGVDIVQELIERHRKDFADKPWKFLLHDIIKDGLKENCDLILCRHMLQNLTTKDAIAFLAQLSRSGSHFLFTTSFHFTAKNTELNLGVRGRFRDLNLEAPPVSLAAPLCYIRDGPPNDNHRLMLWKMPLQQVLGCEATTLMKVSADRCSTTPVEYHALGNWSI